MVIFSDYITQHTGITQLRSNINIIAAITLSVNSSISRNHHQSLPFRRTPDERHTAAALTEVKGNRVSQRHRRRGSQSVTAALGIPTRLNRPPAPSSVRKSRGSSRRVVTFRPPSTVVDATVPFSRNSPTPDSEIRRDDNIIPKTLTCTALGPPGETPS